MNLIKKGFTLIELLVVIGILAVLMAGVVALIDPIDKTRQANDATMQASVANVATGQEAYAATHNGTYAPSIANLVTAGELKSSPNIPTGYAAISNVGAPAGCTLDGSGAGYCTSVVVCATLMSKKYTSTTTPAWVYYSGTGRTGATTNCTTMP